MRTAIIIVAGLAILGVFRARGLANRWRRQSMRIAAVSFVPAWLIVALINMWLGVSRAGYSVAEELPIFPLDFHHPGRRRRVRLVALFVTMRLANK